MLTSLYLHMKRRRVCIKTRSTPTSLPLEGQVTKHTTVKWTILITILHINSFVVTFSFNWGWHQGCRNMSLKLKSVVLFFKILTCFLLPRPLNKLLRWGVCHVEGTKEKDRRGQRWKDFCRHKWFQTGPKGSKCATNTEICYSGRTNLVLGSKPPTQSFFNTTPLKTTVGEAIGSQITYDRKHSKLSC